MAPAPATQVHSFHLDAPLTRVLPLFTAQGERAWVPGWSAEILSGAKDRGSVFRTQAHCTQTVWHGKATS
jgi:hypothetical protein